MEWSEKGVGEEGGGWGGKGVGEEVLAAVPLAFYSPAATTSRLMKHDDFMSPLGCKVFAMARHLTKQRPGVKQSTVTCHYRTLARPYPYSTPQSTPRSIVKWVGEWTAWVREEEGGR